MLVKPEITSLSQKLPTDEQLDAGARLLFTARLKHAVEAAGGLLKVAQKSAVPKRTLSHYLAGTTDPKAWTLLALAAATSRSVDWLLGGDPAEEASAARRGEPNMALSEVVTPAFALIPRYDVKASAGRGSLVPAEEISDYLAFKREWFSRIGLNPQNAALVTADGDSMESTIPNGAMLLLDLSIVEVANGYIYAIRREGELLVKRVQQRFDGTVVLISDNPRYEREEVPPERVNELHVVGRVRWIAHDL